MDAIKKIFLVSRCSWTLFNFRTGLICALKEAGHFVVGGGAGGDGYEAKVESLGILFVRLPLDKRGIHPGADLKFFWSLYRWYRKEKPDIVHHFTIKPVIYGSIAARLAGVPKIINTVTGLGYVFTEEKGFLLRGIVEWLYRLALSSATFTFFQNKDDLGLFLKKRMVSPKKAGLLAGSGVNTDHFSPRARLHEKPLTFLMIARLLRHKGVHEFVEAARLVKKEYPDFYFQIVGGRDERNPTVVSQNDLNRWKKENVIVWLGEVEDVRSVVEKADVVVLPSYREGTPRSLLEAASMGKPLIATDVTGCREVVEDGVNGFLVPSKDVQALAEAMRKMILDSPLRFRMGKAGREKILREFDETAVVQKIIDVYDEVNL